VIGHSVGVLADDAADGPEDVATALVGHVAGAITAVPTASPLRVAVDGITASGKTTFADALALAVRGHGRPCLRVSMDGFHNPRNIRHRQGRDSAIGYYEDAYDFDAVRRALLDPLSSHGDGRYRTAVLDLARETAVEEPPSRAPKDLVLVVYGSFLQRDLRDAWDIVIYLRADFATAAERGAIRDAAALGSIEEAQRLFAVRYHAAARRYVDENAPEATADFVIDNDDPASPFVVREPAP